MSDLNVFRERFLGLLGEMSSDAQRRSFLSWIKSDVSVRIEDGELGGTNYADLIKARTKLHEVSESLAKQMPNTEAIFESEKVTFPTVTAADDDESLTKENTIHVDAFLYDAAAEEAMVEEGILPTAFCSACGSKDVQNYTYITHSCSKSALENMFTQLLPELSAESVVLDVGSRLGAVLYGAYLFTQAKQIIGVEMNTEHCQLSKGVCSKFGFKDRIQIECSEMTTRPELFQKADVVILNNVFEFFVSEEGGAQAACWKFISTNLKPGTLIVSCPSIEKSLSKVQTGIKIKSWVEELPPFRPEEQSWETIDKVEDSSVKFHLYRVKKSS